MGRSSRRCTVDVYFVKLILVLRGEISERISGCGRGPCYGSDDWMGLAILLLYHLHIREYSPPGGVGSHRSLGEGSDVFACGLSGSKGMERSWKMV